MNPLDGLDLSGLARFRSSDLLADDPPGERGLPMRVALSLIELDPEQPRRQVDERTITELAASIAVHGVLEPVSLRPHPDAEGRYIVNRGERRVRAARVAGLAEMPAFLDERIDPYAQAVENLHREAMSPFDVATFIALREREGHSRAEIARRLGKPRSFVTEAASLSAAPAELRQAFEAGRLGAGTRVLYRLAVAMEREPSRVAAVLAGEGVVTRARLDAVLGPERGIDTRQQDREAPALPAKVGRSAGRTVLVVEHAGRRGSLRLKAHDNDCAEVRFGDGTRDLVQLKELRLVCWAAEE